MIKIFYPSMLGCMILVFICYLRIRDRIPFKNQNKFERSLIIAAIILLLADISFLVLERREIAYEMNDCIRFYQTFPEFYKDREFYFVRKWCYEYFTAEEIAGLREVPADYQADLGGFNFTIDIIERR